MHKVEFDIRFTVPADGISFRITGEGVDIIKLNDGAIVRHRHIRTLHKINDLMREIIGNYGQKELSRTDDGDPSCV